MTTFQDIHHAGADPSSVGLVGSLLQHGVTLQGDIVLSVAGVDLIDVGLKVFLASVTPPAEWTSPGTIDTAGVEVRVSLKSDRPAAMTGRGYLTGRLVERDMDAALLTALEAIGARFDATVSRMASRDSAGTLMISFLVAPSKTELFLAALASAVPQAAITLANIPEVRS
jgi:hypothetical protein